MATSATSVQRIGQACERCRVKRARCSGEQSCSRCQRAGQDCSFGHPRANRIRSSLAANDQYDKLIRSSRPGRQTAGSSNPASPTASRSSAAIERETLDSSSSSSPNVSDGGLCEDLSQSSIGYTTDSTALSPTEAVVQWSKPKRISKRAKARKTRVSSACLECKKRRRKCTGQNPCQTCIDYQTECVYDPLQDRRRRAYMQKRLPDSVLEAPQPDRNEELMNFLQENMALEYPVATGIERVLRVTTSSSGSNLSPGSSNSSSEPDAHGHRLVCPEFCGLAVPGSDTAGWYPSEHQEWQRVLLNGPEHLILPHVIDDQSPLSMMFVDFRRGVEYLVQQGTPVSEVLGPLDPVVDLLFRPRHHTDSFSASTWACELARLHVHMDIFTQLATAMLFARFMRWVLVPSLENFLLLPEIIQPTHAQKTIPHYASADLYPIPAVRDCLIRGEFQLPEPVGTLPGEGIRFDWPFDLESAIDRHPVTGVTTVSRLFSVCAAEEKNWTVGRDFLANMSMGEGILNVIDHQHGWASKK